MAVDHDDSADLRARHAFDPRTGEVIEDVDLLEVPARRRGGNRLPVGHPARGRTHRYPRQRMLPEDHERRDRHQRERTRRAAIRAVGEGALTRSQHQILETLISFSDEHLTMVWPTLGTIGQRAGGLDERTVGRHMQALKELGWVAWNHRYKFVAGRIVADSNLWRVDIPPRYRAQLHQSEDRARQRKAKGRATTKAPQNRPDQRSWSPERTTPPSPTRRNEQETRHLLESMTAELGEDDKASDAVSLARSAARNALNKGHAKSPP